MKIILTGSSGLIGSALGRELRGLGHQVLEVGRNPKAGQIAWDFVSPFPDELIKGADALIHLAGENVAAGYWTSSRKAKILDSRITSTLQIASAIQRTPKSNFTFICASAVGFYGSRGAMELSESATRGSGFLSDVCVEWEAAAQSTQNAAVRVISARFGVVLSADGGALKKMLPSFRLGLGAILGDGRQFMSWITRDDAVRALTFCLEEQGLSGPVNICSPRAVSNRDFSHLLAAALKSRLFLSAPAWILKLLLGQMAEEVLLASTRTRPGKLLDAGFEFNDSDLASAFSRLLP